MKIEQQVSSLELAQKLKELGAKQESLWYWVKRWAGTDIEKWKLYLKDEDDNVNEHVSAFTVAELSEMLPSEYYSQRSEPSKEWVVMNEFDDEVFTEGKTQADALAEAIIKRHNLIHSLK